jgi:cytochrome c biogenesis protein
MTTTSTGPVPPADLEAERLSTAPQEAEPPRRGARPSPAVRLRRGWRLLTSMRTALLLLFLLALGAVPGGLLPQRSLNPVRVSDYLAAHPAAGPLLDRLSMFDVFKAPWFSAVYLLLFVSLVGCLVPRVRLHLRALRTPPPAVPAVLSRLPVSDRWETDLSADEALAAARTALRRGRWRTVLRDVPGGGAVSAEKGYLRETGNLVFHVSLVVLLIGIAVGAFWGFKGSVLVKEGDGFANTVLSFDDIHPGRRFDPSALVPLNFQLDSFDATYSDTGEALTFDARLRYATGPDAALRPYDVRVNHPLHVGGAKVYLVGHGYAPRVVVRDASGAVALDKSVPCLPQDTKFVSNCVIKVPDAVGRDGQPAQMAFEGVFTPTTVQDPVTKQVTSVSPAPNEPVLTVVGYRGDLQLDAGTPQSVYALDTSRLTPVDRQAHALRPGESWQLAGGGSITFTEPQEWATFQVTQDPGKGLALVAACGMVGGLLLSLFIRRRRVWVRVRPAAAPDGGAGGSGRTVVEVGGLARTDPDAFAAEFEELVARLRNGSPGTAHGKG